MVYGVEVGVFYGGMVVPWYGFFRWVLGWGLPVGLLVGCRVEAYGVMVLGLGVA